MISREVASRVSLSRLQYADLDAVATMHRAAFPASALTKLGHEAVRRYYAWQLEAKHELYAFGAFASEDLAGFCFCGVVPDAIPGFVRKNATFLARRIALRPWLIAHPLFRDRIAGGLRTLKRFGWTPVATPPPVPGRKKRPFDILAIAVHPRFQGAGIGKILMREALRLATENDFYVMTLMVNPENGQAIGFYESIGWHKALMNGKWRGNMVYWMEEHEQP